MKVLLSLFAFCMILTACNSSLPEKGKLPDMPLTNQEGEKFRLSELRGHVVVLSYIYTHCPDVCHVISKRMDAFKDRLKKNGIEEDIYFVSISIDPKRDTPKRLKNHVNMMNLDTENWVFATGDIFTINSILEAAGIDPVKGPIEFDENDEPSYTLTHRNRISLMDQRGQLRKHYKGTQFDMDELLQDIKKLL